MSDLIDLNSPEQKKLHSELPSPLIPPPANDSPEQSPLSISDSRKSMDNNPFDMVLRKTSEYVSKSSDPFEMVFERATKSENQIQDLTDFTDDLQMIKKKRYSDILKINKTLDESLMNTVSCSGTPKTPKRQSKGQKDEELPSILVLPPSPCDNLSILDQSAMNDTFRTCSDVLNMSNNLVGFFEAPGGLEKSVLNNSAMNDSLSTSENSSDDCFIKSLVAQRVSMCIKKGTLDAEMLDVDDDKGKYCKNHKLRRSFSQGDRMSPRKFRSKRSISIVNDKNSSGYEQSLPSILFEDPFNLGFINGGRGDFSIVSDYSELSNITRLNSVNSGSLYSWKSSCDSANRGFIDSSGGERASEGNFKDLLVRFNSLRMKSNGEEEIKEEKVKDIEDDVFLEEDGVKKSYIFSQANILAKTFEELAEDSARGSNSSGENLLSIRLPSNFDLSPSPPNLKNPSLTTNQSPPPIPSKPTSDSSKKEAAALLLRDLENVVKTENNPEIMRLLKNLEKALGVKCENNLQLLNSCRQSFTNDSSPSKIPTRSPSKSPQIDSKKSDKKSPGKILNSENSQTSSETSTINLQDSKQINNSTKISEYSEINSDKSELLNPESENSTEDNTDPSLSSSTNLNTNKSPKNPSKHLSDLPDSFSTQKLILDIQLALGKLLEDCKDDPLLVLDNLNKLLHPKQSPRPPPSPRKSGLPYRSLKSLTHHSEPQRTPKSLPLRRRSSISHSSVKSRLNDSKEPLQDSRKNSSDPGVELTLEKKPIDVGLKIKSTVPVVDKSKLKKKNSSLEVKRGPMKALVPLGSMQRAPGTPAKRKVPSPLKIATSTPDPSPIVLGKKTTKAKPVASSTPDVPGKDKIKSFIPQSPKGTMSWNISPVTPNAKGSAAGMFGDADGTNGKGYLTPKKIEKGSSVLGGLNRIKEKIIRGRRSEPVKVSPRGKSPLKENNGIGKGKPLNLNAKFRRSSGSLGGFEKENKV